MLNRIVIMGRLGHEPEVRYTQSGKPVASFSLAVDRDFKDKASGERATDWIDVVAWDAKAKEGNAPEESLPPEPGESFSELEDEGELPF